MNKQLLLGLETNAQAGDLLVSDCNSNAVSLINLWPNWDTVGAIIYGPKSSGKTHLLSLWQNTSDALKLTNKDLNLKKILDFKKSNNLNIAIDNIDTHIKNNDSAEAVFHLFNLLKEKNGSILLTATKPVSMWECPLPDLISRLKTLPAVSITTPDEVMLQKTLVKFFSDNQIKVSSDVISYILNRTERSFLFVNDFLQRLDAESLSQKRPITIPFVKTIMDEMQKNS